MYRYSDTQPQFVTHTCHLGRKVYTINYNIKEVALGFGGKYRYNTITLPVGQYDRATVISAIIRHKYSDDKMQAIINNYLLDPNNEEVVKEFIEMQEYRRFAKSLADDFIKEIES